MYPLIFLVRELMNYTFSTISLSNCYSSSSSYNWTWDQMYCRTKVAKVDRTSWICGCIISLSFQNCGELVIFVTIAAIALYFFCTKSKVHRYSCKILFFDFVRGFNHIRMLDLVHHVYLLRRLACFNFFILPILDPRADIRYLPFLSILPYLEHFHSL